MKRSLADLGCVVAIALLAAGCGGQADTDGSPRLPCTAFSPLEAPGGQELRPTDTPDPSRTPLIIAQLTANAAGGEVVEVKNIGPEAASLSGLSIYCPSRGYRFDFPSDMVLNSGDSVDVYTAVAEDDLEDGLYWMSERLCLEWNDDVLLVNPGGRVVYWYVFVGS
jgi:hypothetical protein